MTEADIVDCEDVVVVDVLAPPPQPVIVMVPANTTVDLKIGGQIEQLRWSLAIQNLMDVHHYDIGYVGYTPGSFSLYPLPGRSFMGRLGASF